MSKRKSDEMASSETMFPGVAFITGAAGSGIGNATAHAFVEAGCTRIAITDINPTTLDSTAKSISEKYPNAQILAVAGDISSSDFVDSFIGQVVEKFGRLDYCVNCAGVLGPGKDSTSTSLEEFDKVNAVNYRGCWLTNRAQLKAMMRQDPLPSHDARRPAQRGAIVNIASQLGIVGRPNAAAYCASKGAVIALTRSDAIDYSAHGIRVNCICPGVIETPFIMTKQEDREAILPFAEIAPMKRMGQPYEVADAALFLCSTKASFVQGHAMTVDGGYVIN
ncbi:oxidoreductase [Phyllosticta capitalensis]|uniref:oxidoreductase n=1 Tax=Phyllosticta capitalensis TaxID=121624 RepID=UPI003131F433